MNGSLIDAIRLWEFLAVVGSMLLAWIIRKKQVGIFPAILSVFRRVARRRTAAICIVGILAFTGDALVSWHRPPVPTTFDEFSYLLAADTFAHGRLTNPTPPMAEFFETPEVLVRPSYQSKYPPGQSLFLAVGQRLTGGPLVGVWLSSALACAAICWMLQTWTTEAWALYGGLLAVLRLAWFGAWAQSYWGGMVAALGGALLYGGVRRIVDGAPRAWMNALCSALGIVILANTRPFEGLLAVLPALLVLCVFMLRHKGAPVRWKAIALPIFSSLLVAAALMLQYNRRVTANAWTLPYAAYENQYDPVPSFIFEKLRSMPALDNASMQSAAQDTMWTWRWEHGSGRLIFATSKLLEFWQFLFGAAFSAVLVLLVWRERFSFAVRTLQLAVFLVVQSLAVTSSLFWPAPSPVWTLLLTFALIIQLVLLMFVFSDRWERLTVTTILLTAAGVSVETWRFHSHYVGPVVSLAFFLVIAALRHSGSRIFAFLLPLLVIGAAWAESTRAPGLLDQWANKRQQTEEHLESLSGKQLVFVYYRPNHDLYEEWVHNRAELNTAPVIWAHSRSPQENCKLIRFFADRKIWLLDADRAALRAYSTDCSSNVTPDELIPNQ